MPNDVKIKRLEVRNYRCFEDFTVDCTKDNGSVSQWTVFLGNNNTGKTTLLKAIANMRPVRLLSASNKPLYTPKAFIDMSVREDLDDTSYISCDLKHNEETHSWTVSRGASLKDYISKFKFDGFQSFFQIYAYGVSRYPARTNLSELLGDSCATLFSAEKRLTNIEEWLMQLDYSAKNDITTANNRIYKIQELICGNLFPEIESFEFHSSDELHNYMEFLTKDGWVQYSQLGFGYQSMLSWVIDFCKRMFDRYPDSDNPLHENAIVLIDEIDLHLHPQWQRDIISFLSRAFPNTQFIVTTHSPLVIQSMEDVNLYVLHRVDDKVKVVRSDYNNFLGWTVEEIMKDTMMMGNDTRSDEYNSFISEFDDGLDAADYEKAKSAYKKLIDILHPDNPTRRLLEIQLSRLKYDKTE